jgi:predicted SAM-dependent methyltransferase
MKYHTLADIGTAYLDAPALDRANMITYQTDMSAAGTIRRRTREYVRFAVSQWLPMGNAVTKVPAKLNIGCGYDKREGYLNVDVDPACAPDILIRDGDYSSIPRRQFEEVLAKDVLEHIPRAQTLGALLDFSDYLVDGGKLILQTSSILGVAAKLQESNRYADHHGWTICLFGNQVHPGDFHHTGFTEVTLTVQLRAAGFNVDLLELRDDWLFYAEASKIENWAATAEDRRIHRDQDFLQAAYRHAFFRDVDETGTTHWGNALREGASRKHVAKELFSAPERLFRIAERDGL